MTGTGCTKDEHMKRDAIAIKDADNVATALRNLASRDVASVGVGDKMVSVTLVDDVEFGHKFAIREISRGQDIIKYGEVIGVATHDIEPGERPWASA